MFGADNDKSFVSQFPLMQFFCHLSDGSIDKHDRVGARSRHTPTSRRIGSQGPAARIALVNPSSVYVRRRAKIGAALEAGGAS
jgi:hypothetical protein